MPVDPKQFWEDKLLTWEQGRYGKPERCARAPRMDRQPLEHVAALSTSPSCRSCSGPSWRASAWSSSGAGRDFSRQSSSTTALRAISASTLPRPPSARPGKAHGGRDARIAFAVGGVADLQPLAADLVMSLGLFDWLRDDEIANVFAKSGSADFLHAIAERRPGLQQWLHRAYVQLAYGYRTDSYRPRYFTCEPHRGAGHRGRPEAPLRLPPSAIELRRTDLVAACRRGGLTIRSCCSLHRMRPEDPSRRNKISSTYPSVICRQDCKMPTCEPQYVDLDDMSASTSRQNRDPKT